MACGAFDVRELQEVLEKSGESAAMLEVLDRLGEVFGAEEARRVLEELFPGCELALEARERLRGLTAEDLVAWRRRRALEARALPEAEAAVARLGGSRVPLSFGYAKFDRYRRVIAADALKAVARQVVGREPSAAEVWARLDELWAEVRREADRWAANDAATAAVAAALEVRHGRPYAADLYFETVDVVLSFTNAHWVTRTPIEPLRPDASCLLTCLGCGAHFRGPPTRVPACAECAPLVKRAARKHKGPPSPDESTSTALSGLDSKAKLAHALRHKRKIRAYRRDLAAVVISAG